jgi:hypothetical protein
VKVGVVTQPHIRDKLTSLEADLKCSMRESRRQQRDLQPVIDVTTSSAEKDSISIQKVRVIFTLFLSLTYIYKSFVFIQTATIKKLTLAYISHEIGNINQTYLRF